VNLTLALLRCSIFNVSVGLRVGNQSHVKLCTRLKMATSKIRWISSSVQNFLATRRLTYEIHYCSFNRFQGKMINFRYKVLQLECPVCGCLSSKKDHTAIKCDEREKAERPKNSSIEGEKEKNIPICLLWGQGDDNVHAEFDFLNQIGHDLPGWCQSPRRVWATDWLATDLRKQKN
jgi:hypothetical protein